MIELNCDMGESFGIYKAGNDEEIMPLIDIANVACGFHASDPNHMRKTVALAKKHGVKVGAHPSFPDLQGFGRREMKMPRQDIKSMIMYQVGALKSFLDEQKMSLNHIKPHGSLYVMAAKDENMANAIADAVATIVWEQKMTSSPSPIPPAFNNNSKASVALATPIAYSILT